MFENSSNKSEILKIIDVINALCDYSNRKKSLFRVLSLKRTLYIVLDQEDFRDYLSSHEDAFEATHCS